MSKCPKCGTDLTLVGVRFPARRLCRCEQGHPCGQNNCKSLATVVEFQKPVKDGTLPSKHAKLLCDAHAPVEFASENLPDVPVRKRKHASNVDPQWPYEAPPPSALSVAKVQCWTCKDVHRQKDRRMHNGTMSLCPKCGDDMVVLADEEDAA